MSETNEESMEATADAVTETEKDKPGRREELLQIAVDLFSRNGFKGTSIRDIAKTLGVSVSVIYHYFESKEGLWSAILEYSVKALPGKLQLALAGGGHALERFRRLLRAHLTASSDYLKESKIFLIDYDRMSASGGKASKDIQIEILGLYVGILEELRREGWVKTHNTKILAFNVLGVINWHLRWYRPDGPMTAEALYDEIITFILYGAVGVPPGRT